MRLFVYFEHTKTPLLIQNNIDNIKITYVID